ncbi:CASP-like protein 5B3 isoform X4 [Mangifera indica]|uniref:CASP-like protein 5B3 isoform X4 n=1 Tax=Mangifera indica TaxID=29780 RepID=UPI001CFC1BA6|nr:CASP-like protein 5B3 isoform X4 [Mangifera indica]
MKDFAGTPGTLTGLFLRIAQCVFAAGSIASMATTAAFVNSTAFCYLISSMGLQIIWSFGLAFIDAYALIRKKVLHNHLIVSLFVVGDWVTATLSLAAASAAGGVTVLYFNDLGHCSFTEECQKYQMLGLSMYSLLISQISLKLISQSYGNFDFFILSTETMQEYSITTLKSYRLLSLPHMFYFFPSCLLACCKCNVGFFN